MFDQTDMSCLNMTLHEHRPRALILTPMTLKQATHKNWTKMSQKELGTRSKMRF